MHTWMISGPCGVIRGFPLSITMQPAQTQSQCVMPLANGHRPLTRTPPSTRTAAPAGAAMPAVGAVGLAPHFLRAALIDVAGRDVAAGADHGAPAGRSVRGGDRFDRLHHFCGRRFLPTDRTRHAEAEDPRLAQSLCEVAGRRRACSMSWRRARIVGRRLRTLSMTVVVIMATS